ncbi:MAG: anhydro-N-acetylmuramic acid kinase [Pseudomonadota bacterium]
MMRNFTSLGLMSGTSMDGIDGAVLVTDGEMLERFGPTAYRPFSAGEQDILQAAMADAVTLKDRTARSELLKQAEQLVTDAHCELIAGLLEKARAEKMNVDVIGFHGQTVLHRPDIHLTVQLGLPQKIANRFKIGVVADFRAADVAAGGEGAPLVPVMHLALAKTAKLVLPCAVVNIGGVANVTIIAKDDLLTAFDTGPGNALLNDWLRTKTGAAMDENGATAAKGKVHDDILQKLMADDYFKRPPPKSLDRDHFRYAMALVADLSLEDGAATLTAFTAESLAIGLRITDQPIQQIVIAGGGAHNPSLLRELKKRTNASVVTADDMGWSVNFMEAQAFAFLAARSINGLPLSFPGTTGVKKPLTGGVLFQPRGE